MYDELATWLAANPSSGWPSDTNANILAWANAEVVNKTYATLPTSKVYATVADNVADFNGLTDTNKQHIRDILYIHSGEGVPTANGSPARELFENIFSGTQTLTDLAAAISYTVSRAVDAGLPANLEEADIAEAKRIAGV